MYIYICFAPCFKNMGNGATIPIGQEIWFLLCARFFLVEVQCA